MYCFYSFPHLIVSHIQTIEMINSIRTSPLSYKLNLSKHIHVLIGKLSKTDSLRIVIIPALIVRLKNIENISVRHSTNSNDIWIHSCADTIHLIRNS